MQPEIPEINTKQANLARVYDYDLGGDHNFEVDREMAHRLREIAPDAPLVSRENRGFLTRAMRFCLARGIDQFLDLGSGIPTVGNVHEVAQSANPLAKVVYVDNEPVAVAHTRRLLECNDNATMVHADVRDADTILNAPDTERLLDFGRPLGLLMSAVLHYVSHEDDLPGLLCRYHSVLVPDSIFVVSHLTADQREDEAARMAALANAETISPVTMRTRDEIRALFTGFELVAPGVVWTCQWRPDLATAYTGDPARSACWAGVGIKL